MVVPAIGHRRGLVDGSDNCSRNLNSRRQEAGAGWSTWSRTVWRGWSGHCWSGLYWRTPPARLPSSWPCPPAPGPPSPGPGGGRAGWGGWAGRLAWWGRGWCRSRGSCWSRGKHPGHPRESRHHVGCWREVHRGGWPAEEDLLTRLVKRFSGCGETVKQSRSWAVKRLCGEVVKHWINKVVKC